MFQDKFYRYVQLAWLQIAFLALLMSIGRLIFIFQFGDHTTIVDMLGDFFKTMFVGLRFDLRVATMAFLPLFLLLVILYKHCNRIEKIIFPYSFLICLLAMSATISNFYYYKTYNNYFDIFAFGLIEDDTTNVLICMWSDYPILTGLLCALLLSLCSTKTIHFIWHFSHQKVRTHKSKLHLTFSVFITLLCLTFLARGSLGTFPLKQYHASVSTYEVFNKSTPNGLIALSWANKKHKNNATFSPVSKKIFTQEVQNQLNSSTVIHRTKTNLFLEKNPPNVVFTLMESMGTNLLSEDDEKTNNLLGSLREHFTEDFLFTRFISSTNTTIDTIVSLFFHSNVNSVSTSTAQNVQLSGSVFLPYKKAGYKVIYLTGGSATWRNLNRYLTYQGVDEFYSENDIIKHYPTAGQYTGTWGVPDNYLFDYAQHLLKTNTQPILLVLLTQTNHSPHQVPSYFQPLPISISEKVLAKLSTNNEQSHKLLETFQYSSSSLGDFITNVKLSNKNTIIAATGDHRQRNYSIDYPTDLGTAYSVPLYLHIPDKLLANLPHRYDKTRIGSHRDIFPTLYSFSLSNAEYYSLGGRNLMQVEDALTTVAFNSEVTFTHKGVINNSSPKLIYPWLNNENLQMLSTPKSNPYPEATKNYQSLQTLFINSQVKGYIP